MPKQQMMKKGTGAEAADKFKCWLDRFARATGSGATATGVGSLFTDDGFWKDMLALSWDYELFSGPSQIDKGFANYAVQSGFGELRPAEGWSAPRACRRGGRNVIEAFFEFSTSSGWGIGFVRLLQNEQAEPKAWILLTALYGLDAAPERIGDLRPSGDEYSQYLSTENWAEARAKEVLYEDRDPEVIVIGAGHSALSLSARLKTMGVDVLLMDRTARIGDSWRKRYHSLSLHNPIFANHMPYVSFPASWHTWVAKDKLAGWLEAYADMLELNVWTNTTVTAATFDSNVKLWTLTVRGKDGNERTIKCKQLVFATGVSGSIPNMPDFPGIENFKGELTHSSSFSSGKKYKGKKTLVIGTGNSGHDVAQDLVVNGAEKVVMLQRGPTCVVSLRPTAETVFSVYAGDGSVDEIDLMAAAIPYPVLVDTYQWLVNRARTDDAKLIESLRARGFKTHYGDDETGFHMMYLRGEGGYYIDVGCSRLIIEGKVEILSNDDVDCFVAEGVRLKNGSILEFDLIVAATGFQNMQENIRRILGDAVADRVGPIWGLDDGHALQNMWRRTPQEAFWVMGGGLTEARMFSRMLALQITASLKGVLAPKPDAKTARSA